MIQGVVTPDREAVIRFVVQGPAGQEREVDAVIDTGFNDYLTLPPDLIATLWLPFAAPARATLADGSEIEINYHRATVIWDGAPRPVLVLASGGGALVGMSLLYGHEMYLHAVDGGTVTIKAAASLA